MESTSDRFKLDDVWRPNIQMAKIITFKFGCKQEQDCKLLAEEMRQNPHKFNSFDVQYVVNGQKSARRELTITGEQISQGNLFTRLQNMNGGQGVDERYLKSDDVKILAEETVSSIRASLVTDASYVDSGDEVSLKDLLKKELEKQKVSSASFDKTKWNSTFWDPGYARPDKITEVLNKLKEENSTKTDTFNETKMSEDKSHNTEATLSYSGFSGSGNYGESGSDSDSTTVQDVLDTLNEKDAHVEWEGEMFVTKPLNLSRINLNALRSSSNIVSESIQLKKYRNVFSMKLAVRSSHVKTSDQLSTKKLFSELIELEQNFDTNKLRIWQELQDLKEEVVNLTKWDEGNYCIVHNFDPKRTKETACASGFRPQSWTYVLRDMQIAIKAPTKSVDGSYNYLEVKGGKDDKGKSKVYLEMHFCCRGGGLPTE